LQQLRARFGEQRPTRDDLHAALQPLVAEIATHGTFNMLLSSGGELFAHCSTRLFYLVRQHPFDTAMLSDEDVTVDFAQVTTPDDRVAVIVTEPLTTNERWIAFAPGELKLFIDGAPQQTMQSGD
jgi:glutamine amidotransferase